MSITILRAEIIRPANATPFAVGDVVGTATTGVMPLAGAATLYGGGSGRIRNVRLEMNSATVTNAQFRIYFFSEAPAAIADNAPFTLLWADRAKRLGFVDLTLISGGAGSDAAEAGTTSADLIYLPAAGATGIFAVITALAAYTPISGMTFQLEVGVERN